MDAALPAPAFASQVSGARRGEGALRRLPVLLAPLRRPPRRAARGLRRDGDTAALAPLRRRPGAFWRRTCGERPSGREVPYVRAGAERGELGPMAAGKPLSGAQLAGGGSAEGCKGRGRLGVRAGLAGSASPAQAALPGLDATGQPPHPHPPPPGRGWAAG